MISVEAVPVLDKNACGQVIDVFLQIDALREEIESVSRAGKVMAKALQLAKSFRLLRFFSVVGAVRTFRAEIALIRTIGIGNGFEQARPF